MAIWKTLERNSLLARAITPRRIIIAAVNVLLLIAFVVCIIVSNTLRSPLHSQQAARAWAGQSGERFAQVSVFIPESVEFTAEHIHRVRASIDSALLDVGLETTPERRLYADAWSAEWELAIVGERAITTTPITASAIGVGGDFFLFYPLQLRSGNYIAPDDFMRDRVVLDEELAWGLFGGIHLAELGVLIGEKPFVVAGVVSRADDFASRMAYAAYTESAGFFMSYEALMALTEDKARIATYQIVMPDPITGFALNAVTEAIKSANVEVGNVHILENSARFTLGNSFRAIAAFGERSIRNEEISYPYWENAARIVEDWLALLLVLALVFIAFPLVCTVVYTVKTIRFLINRGKQKFNVLVEEHDKRAYEKYREEHKGEHTIYDIDEIIREVKES